MDYELIIIGTGPAGMTASIYAARYKVNHLIIGEMPGGLMSEAHKICNFPSELEISGFDLMTKMKAHVDNFGTTWLMKKVDKIEKIANGFKVSAGEESWTAKTIILATGTKRQKLGLAREAELTGKGVAYCATCDAMFYKDKVTAVVGGGNSAMTAALQLAEFCQKVYLLVRKDQLKGETVWAEQVAKNEKIEIIFNTEVKELMGEDKLTGVKLNDRELELAGLFIEVGSIPDSEWLADLQVELNERGYIKVDDLKQTNIPGFLAAGDITTGSGGVHQIVTACAEGAVAANTVFQYIKKN